MKRFDAIACRESSGVEEAKKATNRDDIVHVMDPVFLCNPDIYEKAIKEADIQERNVFFAYIWQKKYMQERHDLITRAAELYNVPYRVCGNPNAASEMKEYLKHYFGDRFLERLSVEDWLHYIKTCSAYIGDSYHGLCFALIFHRPFVIVYNVPKSKNTSVNRIESLLKLVGLEDRLFINPKTNQDWNIVLKKPIDWQDVDNRLERIKNFSVQWLKEVLAAKSKEGNAEDYIREALYRKVNETSSKTYKNEQNISLLMKEKETIARQQVEIDQLRNEIAELRGTLLMRIYFKLRKIKRGLF
jgi:hypothetical protein